MAAFWVMCHILTDASLMSAIRTEITPVMTGISSKEGDISEIMHNGLLRSCPLLNSVFNEIIRFYNTGSSIRQTVRSVRIGGKVIPAGSKILLPQRQLLLAPEVFGHDAHVVNPYRFLLNKDIERHAYYRPFGQGITQCSGKTIGRYEVLSFVAWALWRYEFKVVLEVKRA